MPAADQHQPGADAPGPTPPAGDAHAAALAQRRKTDALGRAFTWLCGGALALNLLLILGLLLLIAVRGLGYFWQRDLVLVTLEDGGTLLGEINLREQRPASEWPDPDQPLYRIRLKVGNRDVTGADFVWLDEAEIAARSYPADAVVLERLEWGNFYGTMSELRAGEEVEVRLREGLRQVRASTGTGSVCAVVEVAPWSRIPETRALVVPRDT